MISNKTIAGLLIGGVLLIAASVYSIGHVELVISAILAAFGGGLVGAFIGIVIHQK